MGGRVVMVVGGSSGIGLVLARRLTERGDRVFVVARDAARLAEVASTLGGGGGGWAAADVSDAAAVETAVRSCVELHGRVDAVVSTAQALAYGRVEDVPAEVFDRTVAIGVSGTANLVRAVLPWFREQGAGHLLVVGSLLGEVAVPTMGAYCAAKAAQLALVRALQVETRREPVHVSIVAPGAVDTPVYDQAGSYTGSRGSAPPPVVSPERVAAVCARVLERPRRLTHVGPGTVAARTGFRLLPWAYDRLAGPLVDRIVHRGPHAAPGPGNVLRPRVDGEAERGGWTVAGRYRGSTGARARWRRR